MVQHGGFGQGGHGPPAPYGRAPYQSHAVPAPQPARPYHQPAQHQRHQSGQQHGQQHGHLPQGYPPQPQISPAPPRAPAAHTPVAHHAEAPIEQVVRSGIYEQYLSADRLQADVLQLRDFDREAEADRKTRGTWTWLWALFAFVSFFFLVFFPPLGLLTILAVGLAIRSGLKWRSSKARDLENRRYELVGRLVEMMACDMDPHRPLAVRMDLRPVETRSKLVDTTKQAPFTIETYWDAWLWVRGVTLDGTKFDLVLGERMRKRSGWKQGSSGKYKHKVKRKSKHYLTLKVAPKGAKHPQLAQVVQRAYQRPELRPQLARHVVQKPLRFKKGRIDLKASTAFDWNEVAPGEAQTGYPLAPVIAGMFLSVFRLVNLSKRVTKKRSG